MKNKKIFFVFSVFFYLCLCSGASDDIRQRENRITPTVIAVSKAIPAVVNLSAHRLLKDNDAIMFVGKRIGYSLGSGSIIDENGLVVTSAHVVKNALRINAVLADGRRCEAKILACDDFNDIALLSISPANCSFKTIEPADAGDLILGETVIALGNPYGLGSSISRGVLSAVGRRFSQNGQVVFSDLLQTDATICPGNSGGPLINLNGRMIGLNCAIIKGEGNIAFAIPLARIENILAQWLIPSRFRNVSLGIIPAVRRENNGPRIFYLRDVIPGSPAAEAQLNHGLQITQFNGNKITSLLEFSRTLWQLRENDILTLTSASGDRYEIKARKMSLKNGFDLAENKLSLKLIKLTETLAGALNYPVYGALIVSAVPEEKSSTINRGDLLLALDGINIHGAEDLARVLQDKYYGDKVRALFVSPVKINSRVYFRRYECILPVR